MAHWLFKTEPDCYSIGDLAAEPEQTTFWDGVRNYQARNLLRDQIKTGDQVLLYHSSMTPMGIVGLCEVVRQGYPDHTALDRKAEHYDPKSTRTEPIWYMVDIKLIRRFPELLTLPTLRNTKALSKMELLRKGSRLSIQPVSPLEFKTILKLTET